MTTPAELGEPETSSLTSQLIGTSPKVVPSLRTSPHLRSGHQRHWWRRPTPATSATGRPDTGTDNFRYLPTPSSVGPRATATPSGGTSAKRIVLLGATPIASLKSRPTLSALTSNAALNSMSRGR